MAKIPVIHKCSECAHFVEYYYRENPYQDNSCSLTDKKIEWSATSIPSWCPLPDAPEKNICAETGVPLMRTDLPKEPGYYWARSSRSMGWYDMIVRVYGDSPFFKIEGWILSSLTPAVGEFRSYDVADFGPKINKPDVPKEKIAKGQTRIQ